MFYAEEGMRVTEPIMSVVAVVVAAANTSWFFGQATPSLDLGLGQLVGNLGIMGVLVWHMWYHTTKTYPMMLDKFSVEVERLRVTFHQEQNASRAAHATETGELRNMLIQNLQAMRTAVHDVKDTAQVAMNRVAIAQFHQQTPMQPTRLHRPEGDEGQSEGSDRG